MVNKLWELLLTVKSSSSFNVKAYTDLNKQICIINTKSVAYMQFNMLQWTFRLFIYMRV